MDKTGAIIYASLIGVEIQDFLKINKLSKRINNRQSLMIKGENMIPKTIKLHIDHNSMLWYVQQKEYHISRLHSTS